MDVHAIFIINLHYQEKIIRNNFIKEKKKNVNFKIKSQKFLEYQ